MSVIFIIVLSMLESLNAVLVNTAQANLQILGEGEEHVWGGGRFIDSYVWICEQDRGKGGLGGWDFSLRDTP